MVAVSQLIPKDPQEQASVLAVLREHPELRTFIQRASTKIEEMFPDASIELHTMQYDDWDPPIRMLYHVREPWDASRHKISALFTWLASQPDYDYDLIAIDPHWHAPDGEK